MFDILSEAVTDTAECELNKANGDPMTGEKGKRCSITFFGPATDEFARMQAAQRKRVQDRVMKRAGDAGLEAERREKAEDLASITKSFNHFTYPGEFATPAEMFTACYLERKLGFIRDQGNAFVSDWGNFSGDSPTS